jgi:hypothetical protein
VDGWVSTQLETAKKKIIYPKLHFWLSSIERASIRNTWADVELTREHDPCAAQVDCRIVDDAASATAFADRVCLTASYESWTAACLFHLVVRVTWNEFGIDRLPVNTYTMTRYLFWSIQCWTRSVKYGWECCKLSNYNREKFFMKGSGENFPSLYVHEF